MMIKLACFLLLTFTFLTTYASAQPELDTTFASTGKVVAYIVGNGGGRDVVVQPDKKIVMFSSCWSLNYGAYPLCLVRLNENGSFDTTFGTGLTSGVTFTSVPGASSAYGWSGEAVALQGDGKIVAVGYAASGTQRWLIIARYNTNGTLDASFGTNGIVKTALDANYQVNRAYKVAVQPDGKIVFAGYMGTSPSYEQVVARLNADGTPDATFGSGGFARTGVSGYSVTTLSMDLQADGKIVTGGNLQSLTSPTEGSYFLARLNTNGTLDATFDQDGLKTINYSGANFTGSFVSIAVQSDGRILALVSKNILYRFNSDGSEDTSFDGDGSRTALNGASSVNDVIVTPSGKITVIGHTSIAYYGSAPILYRISRYLPNGAPDISFSDDGFLEVDVADSMQDGALSAATDPQGRTVVAGQSAPGTVSNPWENSQYSLVRLIASPAQNVEFSGRVTDSNGRGIANAYLNLKNGPEIVGYARTNPFGYFRFKNVQSNITYTLSTISKTSNFYDRSVLVDGAIENYLIVGEN